MRRILVLVAAFGLLLTAAVPAGAASPHSAYDVRVLVSDGSQPSDFTDANLVNAWGLSRTGTSPWWVSDNETNVSTLYNGIGTPTPAAAPLVVSVPGAPTGTVADTNPGFMIANAAGTTARAVFLFDTEDGTILGWNPTVAPTTAVLGLDRSGVGAIYKGLAIALVNGVPTLYAADFHNARVDVVTPDPTTPTTWVASDTGFDDPGLPAGYAPFGIQNIDNTTIFVTYAKQDADAEDEIAGDGFGFVDAFGLDGSFQGRVASGDALNAPWGLAKAPDVAGADFGEFSGQLLVGNFGDGRINAFRWGTWEPDGHLKTMDHRPLTIDGLWAIAFGAGNANSGPSNSLFFTAGPEEETHGAFGTVTVH